MPQTLLIFSTYIDEIPLHAGGLIANHTRTGDRVIAVAMCFPGYPSKIVDPDVSAENPFGRFKTREQYIREHAQPEADAVRQALGLEKIITWDYEGHTESLFLPEAVDRVTDTINDVAPDIVVTHWPIADYTDFVGAGSAVLRALIERRITRMPQVYFSETLTGRHTLLFAPNTYVDISESIATKREACAKIWQGKCVDYFFEPYALPIAHFRGRECGVEYAEAYAALHGSFGLEKQPHRAPVPQGANPRTMRRAVDHLTPHPVVKGVYPTYDGKHQLPATLPTRVE